MYKRLFFILILSSILAGFGASCSKTTTPSELNADEAALATEVGMDHAVALVIKEEGKAPLERLMGRDEEFREAPAAGLTFQVSEKKAEKVLFRLRDHLAPNGYMVFIVERNYGFDPDRVAVIRGADPFEILRIRATNGINYDFTNADVVAKLKEWDSRYGLDIIAADFDFVEAIFKKSPTDVRSFAGEVYEFCPDVVDQGTGSIEALAAEMKKAGRLYLWWD